LDHEDAKERIIGILGSNVHFEGHFNICFDNLKESQKEELVSWVDSCFKHDVNPIQSKKDRNMIGFVKHIGSNLRTILTKEKSGYYIALFLDKHKYYETELNKLGF